MQFAPPPDRKVARDRESRELIGDFGSGGVGNTRSVPAHIISFPIAEAQFLPGADTLSHTATEDGCL